MSSVKIIKVSFEELVVKEKNTEGLVILGAGGNLQEWLDGIQNILIEENHVVVKDKSNPFWQRVYKLTTLKGRTDLVLFFNKNNHINLSTLVLWRLEFGDCSWLIDYIVNYIEQHECGGKS